MALSQLHNKEVTTNKEAPLPLALLYQYSPIVVSTSDEIINPEATHRVPTGVSASDKNLGS